MMALLLMAGLCAGCGKEEAEINSLSPESKSSESEEQSGSASEENNDIVLNDTLDINTLDMNTPELILPMTILRISKQMLNMWYPIRHPCSRNWKISRRLPKSTLRWQRQLKLS